MASSKFRPDLVRPNLLGLIVASILAPLVIGAPPASAQRSPKSDQSPKQFTPSEKANARLAKKLAIPVYFALPASARGPVPANIPINATLVDFSLKKQLGR